MKGVIMKDVDNQSESTSILGCWRKSINFIGEFTQYSEAEIIEFNSDWTGVWKHWDDLVSLKTDDYPFTYRVQGRRLIISYITFPERYDVLDFRVADGHLILIEDYGLPSEDIEVYNTFSPNKIKQRNKYNDK